ncbi:Ribonuclease Oy [Mizuhopecten yessoensis]|uniref:Ribonuclease Oy n=2 Tax=Mizuhopecten yessoensis TaxID=6573 RepID=A0A210Q9R3_MIZYE|nr:Ribonuclease Oy [Mizuhopecten yessoensis]
MNAANFHNKVGSTNMVSRCVILVLVVTLIDCISPITCKNDTWDRFIFTQEWPIAVCEKANETGHKCLIPSQVNSWGIHGLWPTNGHTRGPTECHISKDFNFTMIKPLVEELQIFWPNIYADTNMSSFWKHEWEKHGRCATTLPATANEYLYFKQSLQLMKKFSASTLLKNKGILPSKTAHYRLDQIQFALMQQLGNKTVIVECTKDSATGLYMIFEVEICLDKKFNPINCYAIQDRQDNSDSGHFLRKHKSRCPRGQKAFEYPPIPKH